MKIPDLQLLLMLLMGFLREPDDFPFGNMPLRVIMEPLTLHTSKACPEVSLENRPVLQPGNGCGKLVTVKVPISRSLPHTKL